jgi:alpha-tubulin suppressor-like RCC1 family protein
MMLKVFLGQPDGNDVSRVLPALRWVVTCGLLWLLIGTVSVTKADPLSSDSALSSLVVNPGVMDFGFSPGSKDYTACVPSGTSSVTVTPVASHSLATVAVNGAVLPSAVESPSIPLVNGGCVATVTVTAEDGTSSTYTVNFITAQGIDSTYSSGAFIPATYPALDATGLPLQLALGHRPQNGGDLTVVDNTGLNFIKGRFEGLAQGQLVTLGYEGMSYRYLADYHGGTGNDLILRWFRPALSAWGDNSSGNLGNGSEMLSMIPTEVVNSGALAGKTVFSFSSGRVHSLALCADGSIAAWGGNTNGYLGNNSTSSSGIPVTVLATGVLAGKTVVSVSAGSFHSLAVCSDGTVAAWGSNSIGQLGNGSFVQSLSPVSVLSSGVLMGKTVIAVSAGYSHSLALCSDGTVAAWGSFSKGELGTALSEASNVPVLVDTTGVLSGRKVIGISAGGAYDTQFSLAVCSDGRVAAWGANANGQLGDGAGENSTLPVLVDDSGVLSGKSVMAVSAGDSFALALCSDGTVATWGNNNKGQLGNNSKVVSGVPVRVDDSGVLFGKTVTSISAGVGFGLAVCSDGTLASWGSNIYGMLGDNTKIERQSPVSVMSTGLVTGRIVKQVDAGDTHCMAISPVLSGPELSSLSIPDGELSPGFSPQITSYFHHVAEGVSSVSLLATARDGGEINVNGTSVIAGTLVEIPLNPGINTAIIKVTAVSGVEQDYFIRILVGNEMDFVLGSSPVQAQTGAGFDFSGITANLLLDRLPIQGADLTAFENTAAGFILGKFTNLDQGQTVNLAYEGVIYTYVVNYYGGSGNDLVLHWHKQRIASWGSNMKGRLGTGSSQSTSIPVSVLDTGILAGKTVVSISSRTDHGLALCSDGTIAAWGANERGQLGDGTLVTALSPVAVDQTGVLAEKTVVAISAGNLFSLALCSDGTVAAWGANNSGRLGDGSTNDQVLPVMVDDSGQLAGKTVVTISAGSTHSVALCSDGTVVTWGSNSSSQLGDGTNVFSPLPVSVNSLGVLAGRSVVSVSAGDSYSLALCSDGKMTAWGLNASGQLGIASTTTSNIPVEVIRNGALLGKKVTGISAGASHCLAVCSDGSLVSWGSNGSGQLGIGTKTNSTVPQDITGTGGIGMKTVVAVAAGAAHSLVCCTDGTMVAWGSNNSRQLAINSMATSTELPEVVRGGSVETIFPRVIASASTHSLALGGLPADSKLSALVIGSGSYSPAFSAKVTEYVATVPSVTTSVTLLPKTLNALAQITVNGVEIASGQASQDIPLFPGINSIQIVVTAEDGISTPYHMRVMRAMDLEAVFQSETDIPVIFPRYEATGLSGSFSLGFAPAVGTNLTVIENTGLEFIAGQFTNLTQGQAVDLTYQGKVYHFVANYYGGTGNDLVLEWAKRSIASWGSNGNAQLGNSIPYPKSLVPIGVTRTAALNGKCVVAVGAGEHFGMSLDADGTLANWGFSLGRSSAVPGVMLGGTLGKTAVAISAANTFSLVLFSDGTMGRGINGSYGPYPAALGVLAGKPVIAISKGGNHCLALCSDGTIAAWGSNQYGQLGDGTTTTTDIPVAVKGGAMYGKKVIAVTTGLYHSMALCSDGCLLTWGNNSAGQLGNNTTANSTQPVVVSGKGVLRGKTIKALSQGAELHSVVICSDGTVATWGSNSNGQLGRSSSLGGLLTPETVDMGGELAGKKVVSISSGWRHNIAVCSDGTVVTWGDNSYGQLGNNTTFSSWKPVKVIDTGELHGKKALSGAGGLQSHVIMAEANEGYFSWISELNGTYDRRLSSDPDSDGIPNLLEYVLHGNPGVSQTAILPTVSEDGENLVFSFKRLADSEGDTVQEFQTSSDMVVWTSVSLAAAVENRIALGETDANGDQQVTITLPKTPGVPLFGRLKVGRTE